MFKAGKTMRLFFLNTSALAALIIWLGHYTQTAWLSYIIPGLFLFAGITGFCPGMILMGKLFGDK